MSQRWRWTLSAAALLACALLALPALAKGKPGGGGGNGGGGSAPAGTVYFTLGTQMYTMDADGSNKTAVGTGVRGQPSHDLHDGSRWFLDYRAVSGTYPDGRTRRELFAVQDDGAATQLTDRVDLDMGWQGSPFGVCWTPDDGEISFIARRWNTTSVIEAGIYTAVIDYDAGEIVGLVAQPAVLMQSGLLDAGGNQGLVPDIGGFDWSPDGDSIVHNTLLAGGFNPAAAGLTIVDLAGSSTTTLTTTAAAYGPVWSPDGARIAYGANDIWTIRPDGTGETRILRHRGANGPLYGEPRWSPDSAYIICTGSGSIDSGSSDVFRISAGGRGKTNLTDDLDTRFLSGTPAAGVAWR